MIRFNAHFGELTTRRKHNKYGVSVIQYPSRVIELEYLFKKVWVSMQEVSRRADILRFVCTNAMLAKTRDSASRVDTNKKWS